MSFTIVIAGRPNVGKSTLFNRLARQRLALVSPIPGLTRDWRQASIQIDGETCTIIDTAGLESKVTGSLDSRMSCQSEQAIAMADVILFVVDVQSGLTALDRHFAGWLRDKNIPLLLVANKAESARSEPEIMNTYELGVGEPIAVSAEHGIGVSELMSALSPLLETTLARRPTASIPPADNLPVRVAVLGRPNAGKSTLINTLLGRERLLVGPEPGITRDAITIDWCWLGQSLQLIDTAGLRRRSRIDGLAEQLAVNDALRKLRLTQAVILLVDSSVGLDRQDLTIARMAVQEGRAMILALNKWDLVTEPLALKARFVEQLADSLSQVRGIPMISISARNGKGLKHMMNRLMHTHSLWNKRIPTPKLNRWLAEITKQHPPTRVEGKNIRLRFLTQVTTRPPSFALWLNRPGELPTSYQRYLLRHLRDTFDFPGVPLRLWLRKDANPYVRQEAKRAPQRDNARRRGVTHPSATSPDTTDAIHPE